MEGRFVEAGKEYITLTEVAAVFVRLPKGTVVRSTGKVNSGRYGWRFPALAPDDTPCFIDPSTVEPVKPVAGARRKKKS